MRLRLHEKSNGVFVYEKVSYRPLEVNYSACNPSRDELSRLSPGSSRDYVSEARGIAAKMRT